MKFTIIFTVLSALFFAAVSAAPNTNAERLARGLGPNPPRRRMTPVAGARRSQPSGIHNSCNSGTVHCCDTLTSSNSYRASMLADLLGIALPKDTAVGITCSPPSVVGLGHGGTCTQQSVCCEDNHYNGLIVVGCSPININMT